MQHVGVAGDTYTILVKGKDTAGRYCLIDMYVPPAGRPHRHDFDESFTVLEGEVEVAVETDLNGKPRSAAVWNTAVQTASPLAFRQDAKIHPPVNAAYVNPRKCR